MISPRLRRDGVAGEVHSALSGLANQGGREVEKGVCFLNMMRLFAEGIASTVFVDGASMYSTHLY